jgi:hypothetical protein
MADCKDQKYNIFNPDFDKETGNEIVDDPTTGSAGTGTSDSTVTTVVDVEAYDAIGNGTGVDKLSASIGSSRFNISTTGGTTVTFTGSTNTATINTPVYVTSGTETRLAYYEGTLGDQLAETDNLYYDNNSLIVSGSSAAVEITGANHQLIFGVHSATNSNILTVTGSGRVGIGTNDPQAALHVEGSQVYLPNDWVFASDTDTMIRRRTSNSLEFRLAGSDYYVIDATNGHYIETGNFGIGYTPTNTIPSKLSVIGNSSFFGDVAVTGTITADSFVVSTTFITSSILYDSGSTKFGDTSDDTHQFTGSVFLNATLSSSATLSASNLYFPLDGKLVFNSDSDHKNYISADGNDSMIKFFMNDQHIAEFQDTSFVMRNANLFMLDNKELKFGNSDDFALRFNTTKDRFEGFRDSGGEEIRFHVNQSGYFGIGDVNHSASALLHVSGSDWTTLFKVNSDTTEAFRIDKVAISASVPITGTRFTADAGSSTQLAYSFNVGNPSGDPESQMGFYAGTATGLYLVMGGSQKILWDSGNNQMRMGMMGIGFGASVGGNTTCDITHKGSGLINANAAFRVSGSRAAYGGVQARFELTGSGPVPMLSVHSDVSASILEVTASGQVIINDGHATLPGLKFKSQDAIGAGIYFRDGGGSESNDALILNPNDNEAGTLVIRGNGFVGVGDTFPNNKFSVVENSSRPILFAYNSSTTVFDSSTQNGSIPLFGYHAAAQAGIVLQCGQHSDADGSRTTGLRGVGENSDGDAHTQGIIEFSHDGTAKDEKGQIQFKVNDGDDGDSPSVTAMTIKSNGYVGIGQVFATGSAPSGSLHIYGQGETYPLRITKQAAGDFGIYLNKQGSGHWNILNEGNRLSFAYLGTDGASNTKLIRFENDGDLIPNADNGQQLGRTSERWSQLHVGSIFETSERALKENIVSQASQLDNIMKLNPVEFNWKNDSKKSKGFIADEVNEVFPELVSTDETGKATGIEYTKMISVLTQGMKELNEVVKSQQETIEKLIKKIEDKN